MIDFRPMTVLDLDAVLSIETASHEAPWTFGNFTDSLIVGHDATVLQSDEALIGYAIVMKLPGEAELLNITIAAEWRGQGLGRKFLDKLCREARHAGAERMHLEVRSSNKAACTLYEHSGFVQIGARRGYYAVRDGQREDALLMAKTL